MVRKSAGPDEERRLGELAGELLDNAPVLDGLSRESVRRLGQVREQLAEMEQVINLVDRLLRISQPPKVGKLGIRWWLRNGQDRERYPRLVRWLRVKGGRWRADPLKILREDLIERGGTSALNAGQTYRLARLAQGLIKGYGEYVQRLKRIETELVRADVAMRQQLDLARISARTLHGEVTANLLNAGYLLDDDALAMMDSED